MADTPKRRRPRRRFADQFKAQAVRLVYVSKADHSLSPRSRRQLFADSRALRRALSRAVRAARKQASSSSDT